MTSKGTKLRKKGTHLVDKVLTINVKSENHFVCLQETKTLSGERTSVNRKYTFFFSPRLTLQVMHLRTTHQQKTSNTWVQ